jgi:hypothetical protein
MIDPQPSCTSWLASRSDLRAFCVFARDIPNRVITRAERARLPSDPWSERQKSANASRSDHNVAIRCRYHQTPPRDPDRREYLCADRQWPRWHDHWGDDRHLHLKPLQLAGATPTDLVYYSFHEAVISHDSQRNRAPLSTSCLASPAEHAPALFTDHAFLPWWVINQLHVDFLDPF